MGTQPRDNSAFSIIGYFQPYAGIVSCPSCMVSEDKLGWHEIIAVDLAQPIECDGCGKEIVYYESEEKERDQ